MASSLRLNDAGTMVGKAAHGRLKSLAMAVNSNSLHFGRLMVTPSANHNSYRVAFGCVLAHIISTHSKDGDSQWPKFWAGNTVRLGKRNSLDFRYAQ